MKNLYIASLPRSGSTLLGLILDQHSKCFHAGESHYWKKYDPQSTICSCGLIGCPLLNEVYNKIKDDKYVRSIHDCCKLLDNWPIDNLNKELSVEAKRLIHSSHKGLNRLSNVFRGLFFSEVIIEKSTNIRLAQSLIKDDRWKILLLTRDPRGVVNSRKKSAIRHGEKIENDLGIQVLIDFSRIALQIIDKLNVLLVRYEDLCQNPEYQIKKICDFLYINYDPAMLKFRTLKGHAVMGNRMRFAKDDNIIEDLGWQIGLSLEQKKMISENDELCNNYQKLGYKIC